MEMRGRAREFLSHTSEGCWERQDYCEVPVHVYLKEPCFSSHHKLLHHHFYDFYVKLQVLFIKMFKNLFLARGRFDWKKSNFNL